MSVPKHQCEMEEDWNRELYHTQLIIYEHIIKKMDPLLPVQTSTTKARQQVITNLLLKGEQLLDTESCWSNKR